MVLVNGGYLQLTDIKNSCEFFSESDKKKKKNGQGNLKNSGERSRAILALLFLLSLLFEHMTGNVLKNGWLVNTDPGL